MHSQRIRRSAHAHCRATLADAVAGRELHQQTAEGGHGDIHSHSSLICIVVHPHSRCLRLTFDVDDTCAHGHKAAAAAASGGRASVTGVDALTVGRPHSPAATVLPIPASARCIVSIRYLHRPIPLKNGSEHSSGSSSRSTAAAGAAGCARMLDAAAGARADADMSSACSCSYSAMQCASAAAASARIGRMRSASERSGEVRPATGCVRCASCPCSRAAVASRSTGRRRACLRLPALPECLALTSTAVVAAACGSTR